MTLLIAFWTRNTVLSNVKLIGEAEEYVEADSYHFVRFKNADKSFAIELADVPIGNYRRIEFSIGVEKEANNSIKPVGDLDPNGLKLGGRVQIPSLRGSTGCGRDLSRTRLSRWI